LMDGGAGSARPLLQGTPDSNRPPTFPLPQCRNPLPPYGYQEEENGRQWQQNLKKR
jgi:hypothetical protein